MKIYIYIIILIFPSTVYSQFYDNLRSPDSLAIIKLEYEIINSNEFENIKKIPSPDSCNCLSIVTLDTDDGIKLAYKKNKNEWIFFKMPSEDIL